MAFIVYLMQLKLSATNHFIKQSLCYGLSNMKHSCKNGGKSNHNDGLSNNLSIVIYFIRLKLAEHVQTKFDQLELKLM